MWQVIGGQVLAVRPRAEDLGVGYSVLRRVGQDLGVALDWGRFRCFPGLGKIGGLLAQGEWLTQEIHRD